MEKRNFSYLSKKIYYIAPTLAAVTVLLFFIIKPSAVLESQYNTLENEVVNNISDKEVSQKYLYEIEGDPASVDLTFRDENLNSDITEDIDINNGALISLIEKNYSDDYSTLNKLSDKELEVIANNLNLIKIK
jgi:ABC-type microcin C transport system permease subunit YejB